MALSTHSRPLGNFVMPFDPDHRSFAGLQLTSGLEKGEEVYMSYGSHSNDFLFIECELNTVFLPITC